MGTRRCAVGNLDSVVTVDNILDRDDSIRAVRHDTPGRDRNRLTGAEGRIRGPAGRGLTDDAQRTGNVGGANGEAVHCRAGKRRQIDTRDRRRSGHPPESVCKRNALIRKRLRVRKHERLRAPEVEYFAHDRA